MSRLDDELKKMFHRREPSEDFADRVLARIALQKVAPQPEKSSWWRPLLAYLNPFETRRGPMRLAMVGALVCVIVAALAFDRYRTRERVRSEGEAARAQVIFAMQLASSKLNAVQRKVQLVGEDRRERAN